MATPTMKTLGPKSDQDILTELQTIDAEISAYQTVLGVPQVTWTDIPTDVQLAKIKAFFGNNDYWDWS